MRQFFHLFLSLLILFSSNANAITMKSQNGSTWFEMLRTQVPNNQLTQVGDKSFLIETGNDNWAANPGFEAATISTGYWTQGTSISALASGQISGKQSGHITLSAGSYSGTMILTTGSQTGFTPGVDATGSNIQFSLRMKVPLDGYQFCGYRLSSIGVTEITQCATVQNSSSVLKYTIFLPGGDQTKKYMWAIQKTGTIGSPESFDVDDSYVGPAKDLGAGVPNGVFSAKVDSTGVVIDENEDFINGNCTITDTSLFGCTFNTNKFTKIPDCLVTYSGAELTANVRANIESASSSSVSVRTGFSNTSNSFVKNSYAFNITCTRAGTDFVQPTITAGNWDYDWTAANLSTTQQGFGTVTFSNAMDCRHKRDGSDMIFDCKFTAGTVSGSEARISLPNGLTIDSTKTPTIKAAEGYWIRGNSSSGQSKIGSVLISGGNSYVTFGNTDQGVAASPFVSLVGTSLIANSEVFHFYARIPIQGWSATLNAPQLLGSVTSNATSALRDEYVMVTSACTTGTCTQAYATSPWVTITRTAAGIYTLAYPSGTFSLGTIGCTGSAWNGTNDGTANILPNTSTQGTLVTRNATGTLTDSAFTVRCIGPR